MNGLLAICRFELKRILTPGRAVWWILVAAFPAIITLLMSQNPQLRVRELSAEEERFREEWQSSWRADQVNYQRQRALAQELIQLQRQIAREQRGVLRNQDGDTEKLERIQTLLQERQLEFEELQRLRPGRRGRRGPPPRAMTQQNVDTIYTIAIYFLGPSIACMLGALLTAAPSVASELEQHSWIYLATRPHGLFHLVVGKYIVAVLWSASATVVGVLAAVFVSGIDAIGESGCALVGLAVLSAGCYSALYIMIGTLFPKRAMVFCVAYTAGVELFMGFFPAVINRLTVQYRLRSLLLKWTTQSKEFEESPLMNYVASTEGVLLQLFWLASFAAVFLAVALTTVQVREFTTASESDV